MVSGLACHCEKGGAASVLAGNVGRYRAFADHLQMYSLWSSGGKSLKGNAGVAVGLTGEGKGWQSSIVGRGLGESEMPGQAGGNIRFYGSPTMTAKSNFLVADE